jgi:hypothetical protein
MVIEGFGDDDSNFMLQLVQLIGQQESGTREILKLADLQKILEDRGTPIVPFAEQQRRDAQLIAEQQAALGPAGVPTSATGTTAGLPAAPGSTVTPNPQGTGFSYAPAREAIYLSDSGTSFIENLPTSPHYDDITVKGFARILWTLFRDIYRRDYESAVEALATGTIELADDEIELSSFETVKRLMSKWDTSKHWDAVFERSRDLMKSVMKRAASIELNRMRKQGAKISDDQIEGWISSHLPEVIAKTAEVTRREVSDFLVDQLEAGVVDRAELAQKIREHFSGFPNWKADRIVRTEVRDLYNTATLMAAEASGFNRVQALDAQTPGPVDQDCAARNGQIFHVGDAFRETDHPNGTLAWRIVPVNFSIERTGQQDFVGADYDEDREVLTLSNDLDQLTVNKILIALVDRL